MTRWEQELSDELAVIENNADSIYVREQIDGKWQNLALTELPAAQAIQHVIRLIRARMLREPRRDKGAQSQ